MKILALSMLPIFLVSCQTTIGAPRENGPGLQSSARIQHVALSSEACGYYTDTIKDKGGNIALPAFADNNDFGGHARYAPNNYGASVFLVTCPGSVNNNDVPVPAGSTADWFCEVEFGRYAMVTFGPGNLIGGLTSKTLLHNTNYYLYAYDGQNNLISSYGPFVNRHKTLKFTSPFENGFTMTGPIINLEIAHATQ